MKYTIFKTGWGWFGLCSTEKGIFKTCLPVRSKDEAAKYLLGGLDEAVYEPDLLSEIQDKIRAYYKGICVDFSKEPVDLDGYSLFSRKVLLACKNIKYGNIETYKELASLVGSSSASRAVGGVMARNRIPLIIPCHRVLSANGSLCGFSAPGGLDTKKRMLSLENKRT